MAGYWKKPPAYGNPGNNPVYEGPASRQFQQTGGNPGVNPAFNGPARRIVNQRGGASTPGAPSSTRGTKPALTIADRARLRIASIYDPVIKQLTDQINAQAKTQQDSILGYSKNLAGEMSKYVGSFGEIYGNAQKSQASADAATVQRLEGGGSRLANELSGKLGAIGAPSGVVSEIAGGAAATGTGAANAAYASGSADLTRLIAQGAAEQGYAAKQPGFVLQRGQQEIADVARQAAADIESEASSLRAKIPGDVLSETDRLTAARDEKLAAKQKAKQDKIDRAWEAATLKVAYGIPLTAADKRALNAGYGSNPDAVKVRGEALEDAARAAEKQALEAQKALDRANLEAQKTAGRSALEQQKAKARAAAAKKDYWRKRAIADRKAKAAARAAAKKAAAGKTSGSTNSSGAVTADGITGP